MAGVDPISVPYAGPRPSPGLRYAPYVIATGVLVNVANLAMIPANLVEWHNQRRLAAGHYVSNATVHQAVNHIHQLATVSLICVIVFLAAALIWGSQRRGRRFREGEQFVEARLRDLGSRLYPFFWVFLAAAFAISLFARGFDTTTSSHADFAQYRLLTAIAYGCRFVTWTILIALVMRSVRIQREREARTAGLPVPPPPSPYL